MKSSGTYENHRLKQYDHILATAENLFITSGIDKVTVTDIIKTSRLMRSTFYRYFSNKEDVLQAIMQKHTTLFFNELSEKLRKSKSQNTYCAFQLFFKELLRKYEMEPNVFLFINLYKSSYMKQTSEFPALSTEKQISGYHPGSLIKLLLQNYPDESVRFLGTPYEMGVMLVYSSVSFASELVKNDRNINIKYNVSAQNIFPIYLDTLLSSIKREASNLANPKLILEKY